MPDIKNSTGGSLNPNWLVFGEQIFQQPGVHDAEYFV